MVLQKMEICPKIVSLMCKEFLYPVSLSLNGRSCLIAGFGEVGKRKLAGLLAADVASVLVLDPYLQRHDQADRRVTIEARECTREDIKRSFMVFACTSSKTENARLAALCQELNILCNDATEPMQGSFIVPAIARKGGLTATISTSGQSPALARIWRMELEEWLEPRQKLAWLLGRLRKPLLEMGQTHICNRNFFRKAAASPLGEWLQQNNLDACRQWLMANLSVSLHAELNQILKEYADVFA